MEFSFAIALVIAYVSIAGLWANRNAGQAIWRHAIALSTFLMLLAGFVVTVGLWDRYGQSMLGVMAGMGGVTLVSLVIVGLRLPLDGKGKPWLSIALAALGIAIGSMGIFSSGAPQASASLEGRNAKVIASIVYSVLLLTMALYPWLFRDRRADRNDENEFQ